MEGTSFKYKGSLSEWPSAKKCANNKFRRMYGEKGTLLHCWWKCKLVKPLWKTVWRLLKKLKIKLLYNPAIPLLSIYQEKTITWIDTYTLMFIVTPFTIAKIWNQLKCLSLNIKEYDTKVLWKTWIVVYKRNIHRKISLNANATEDNSSWGRVRF